MKKAVLFFVLIFGCFMVFSANVDVTIYCDDGYQPYSYSDNGVAKGLYVDVIKKALSKVQGYNVKIMPIPWKRGLDMVKRGEGFGLFPPYYRPKDRPWMEYSVTILDEEVVLVVKDDILKKQRKWPDDYGDIRIGINSGFMVLKEEEKKKLNVDDSAKEIKTNILKLGMGRIDGYINDKVAIFDTIKSLKASGEYKKEFANVLVAVSLGKESGYIGYTTESLDKYSYKEDFKKKLDAALTEMKKSGEIDKIIGNYTK